MIRGAIQALTFDLDDTLWPIQPVIEHAEHTLQRWLEMHCPRVAARWDLASIRQLREQIAAAQPAIEHDFSAQRMATLDHMLLRCGYSKLDVQRAFDVFFDARHQVDLYPEVQSTLGTLSEHYPLAAITNGNAIPERVGLGMFSFCFHARQYAFPKPHPCLFDAARQHLGSQAERTVHIGDHPVQDVEAARAAGFQAIWVNRAGIAWPEDTPPPATVQSLAEVPALLGRCSSA